MIKGYKNLRAGLLGEHLSHSFSPQIHSYLADYSYKLIEVSRDNLDSFMKSDSFDALNVTIPYKKEVLPYLDYISDEAKKIGCVNTIVRKGKKLYGYNTDYYGFMQTVKSLNVDLAGKKAIILGTGGASLTVRAVLSDCGVSKIINISRGGENNYDNLYLHYDAEVIVNATPVGMYPNNDKCPIDLENFKNCIAVFDLIYNPLNTKLICDAKRLGIKCSNGLTMLSFQAKRASEIFCNEKIDDELAFKICDIITKSNSSIALIGMPSCGKTTIGNILSHTLNREFIDTDMLIEQQQGMTIPEIFEKYGEEYFRDCETNALKTAAKLSGVIISTGGGIVTKARNYEILRQNSYIIFIKRDLNLLTSEGRPLSQKHGVDALYEKRLPLYKKFADFTADNNTSAEKCASEIISLLNLPKGDE